MQKARKKFSKKELREDKFVTATMQAQSYMRENWQNVGIFVAAVIALTFAIIWFMNQRQEAYAETGTKVSEGMLLMAEGRQNEAQRVLAEAAEMGNENGAYAAFIVGRDLLLSGDADSAVVYLQLSVENGNEESLLGPAYMTLASAQLRRDDPASAAQSFDAAAANSPYDAFTAEALYNAALVYIDLEEAAKARQRLEKIVDDHPQSPYLDKAELHLALLNGRP
jgi:tetratricopeptide (TPR) repeat protein